MNIKLVFIVIVVPILLFSISLYLTFKNIKLQRDIEDLAYSVEQKISLLENVKNIEPIPLCSKYYTEAQKLQENYCHNSTRNRKQCILTQISLPNLKEFNSKLESIITRCFKLQEELNVQRQKS